MPTFPLIEDAMSFYAEAQAEAAAQNSDKPDRTPEEADADVEYKKIQENIMERLNPLDRAFNEKVLAEIIRAGGKMSIRVEDMPSLDDFKDFYFELVDVSGRFHGNIFDVARACGMDCATLYDFWHDNYGKVRVDGSTITLIPNPIVRRTKE